MRNLSSRKLISIYSVMFSVGQFQVLLDDVKLAKHWFDCTASQNLTDSTPYVANGLTRNVACDV